MMTQATLDRPLLNFRKSTDTELTTPEMPILRTRSAVVTKKNSRSTSPKVWLGLAAALVVGGGTYFRPSTDTHSRSEARAAHSAESIRSVTVSHPTPSATSSVVLPATIRPWQTTTLHARVSGYLAAWHRDLGAPVGAGELLAEIDTPELDQEVASGEALVREAVAGVAQARAERAEAEADLKVAEAQLTRVEADAELARNQLGRREKLLTSRSVSLEELDTAQKQVEARTADARAAEADLIRRRTNLVTRAAIIDVREATAKSRQATVDRLKELQGFKRIVAPFDGIVIQRSAEVGMLVTAGQESLFTIEDMSRVRVQMNVPQTYAPQTHPGVSAVVTLPESSKAAVTAQITRVAESVDSANRTMLAEIELPNNAARLHPGSYARVTLIVSQDSTAWTIPTGTVSMRVGGAHVVVVDDQNQIGIRRVTLGRELGPRVVVAEGIHGDERLVVNPTDDLIEGMLVEIANPNLTNSEVARK
jgi:multidrug efflux pump subunit AcrA (membrane-fusion protein)